ncbi:release factor glutamine methyltransferase [Desulfosarcina alkanivorans]|uniref:Release factor glutamine methyltransferase n=1 Tax=Desulfosarcina alkanivorans TaxID=571177 RepID=A0A5K7YRU4_9BACT|nr:peptide chain release factor N(5)-glutamine methyltransferase [Desulfosarcina alkanivorans]BBO72542.1 release factor glutamine methyltransferase [Desulfosarcina alkanivorans]
MDRRAPWTPLELVRWTAGYFNGHQIESARSEAEILLAHTLGVRRIDLYLNHDQPLCDDELARFKSYIKRRVDREPVAYITGEREFWSLELAVNPSVLIPRPETECLVEAVLPFLDASGGPPKRVLEWGTGSGAIVIALAHEHPGHRYTAMDRSVDALQTARQNARTHRVDDRIVWFCSDWDAALAPGQETFDLMVSNPPYIRSGDLDGLQAEIRCHEPCMALDGSGDGLACLRHIIEVSHRYLLPGGILALEMGYDQRSDVQAIAAATGQYGLPRVLKDYSGHDRVVVMEKLAADG